MDFGLLQWVICCAALLFAAVICLKLRRRRRAVGDVRTIIVLGSGGHTAEMTALLTRLDPAIYSPRAYVIATTDEMGAKKAQAAEEAIKQSMKSEDQDINLNLTVIPRSREVGQTYLTSVWTTLLAVGSAFSVVVRFGPELVLVNGPGTCIPICIATVLCRSLWTWRGQIVYVESIARVKSLSLSGKILYHLRIADLFFVQWPELQSLCRRAIYSGRIY